MNGTYAGPSNAIRSKGAIITHSVLSIVFTAAAFVLSGLSFGYYGIDFDFNVYSFIMNLLLIAAVVVFITSVTNIKNSAILSTVAFGIVSIVYLAGIIYDLIFSGIYLGEVYYLFSFLFRAILAVFFGLAIISSLGGLKNKVFAILAGSFGLAYSIIMPFIFIFTSQIFNAGIDYILFYLANTLVSFLSLLFLSCAVLVYSIKNRVPAAVGKERNGCPAQNAYAGAPSFPPASDPNSPEAKLAALSAKLEFGIITKEEYDKQRADIINSI